jgi:hypothetical protein
MAQDTVLFTGLQLSDGQQSWDRLLYVTCTTCQAKLSLICSIVHFRVKQTGWAVVEWTQVGQDTD